ncbi:MAG: Endodeoxyribonuclease RusA [Syntrophaceae bacterium PtaB.Bin095]|nr:MAG: Endodeoxyribonuclease RusA [Syntrophaceae bacterium PtaB.Bin095]
MKSMTFSLPFLPPSLNAYRNNHWRKQRSEEKTWKDYIAVKWAEMGRPKLKAVRIAMVFSFPDRRTRDLDNYLATGSKLVGDAVKGLFISDDSPEHLTAWSFRFEFGDEAKTTVVIEEADRKDGGCISGGQAAFWEDPSAPSSKMTAGEQVSAERLSGRQEMEVVPTSGRPVCTLYENCIAPLCPLDRSSLNGIWYPDEEICRSRIHGNLSWMRAQRKIAKSANRTSGYFTLAMLNRNCIIRPGITGLDPNEPEEPQLKRWLDDHPVKREMSEEEILMRKSLAQRCLVRKGDKVPVEGVSTPISKPPLKRGEGRKKCP